MLTRAAFSSFLLGVWTLACTTGDDTNEAASEDTDTTASTESGGDGFACGELECVGEQACLTFNQEPSCTNKQDDEPCPEGTIDSNCGGAGIPCCCGPTPAPIYQCAATTECGELVDCSCLADVCTPSCTATADAKVFICEEPPAP